MGPWLGSVNGVLGEPSPQMIVADQMLTPGAASVNEPTLKDWLFPSTAVCGLVGVARTSWSSNAPISTIPLMTRVKPRWSVGRGALVGSPASTAGLLGKLGSPGRLNPRPNVAVRPPLRARGKSRGSTFKRSLLTKPEPPAGF